MAEHIRFMDSDIRIATDASCDVCKAPASWQRETVDYDGTRKWHHRCDAHRDAPTFFPPVRPVP